MLPKDNSEVKIMHFQSDGMETMIGKNADEIIKESFSSFLCRYQIRLEESIKGRDFRNLTISDTKIRLNRGGSYRFF